MKRRRLVRLWLLLPLLLAGSVCGLFVSASRQRQRDDALMKAIGYGETESALRLLREGANPNQRVPPANRPTILRELLDRLLRRQQPPPQGLTALLLAAKNKERAVVTELLKRGARDLEVVDKDDATVLLLEAQNAHWENVLLLLRRGAAPHGSRAAATSPLLEAVNKGADANVVRAFLAAGADPNYSGQAIYNTPLVAAAGKCNLEVMRVLIDAGADVNAECPEIMGTPLHAATSHISDMPPGERRSSYAAVRLLLQSGADPNVYVRMVAGPITNAINADDLYLFDMLVKAGAKPDIDRDLSSPLSEAASRGDVRWMRRLIAAGADVNLTLRWGETALDQAASSGKIEAVKLLLAHGARIGSSQESYGSNPIRAAEREGHKAVADLLRRAVRR